MFDIDSPATRDFVPFGKNRKSSPNCLPDKLWTNLVLAARCYARLRGLGGAGAKA